MKKLFLFILVLSTNCSGQHQSLKKSISKLFNKNEITIGVSVIGIESGDTFTFNNHKKFPMQSVYKFPIALAVLNSVEHNQFRLFDKLFLDSNWMKKFYWSHVKRQNPYPELYISIDSLIMYMIAYSDNLSSDFLIEKLGGVDTIEKFMRRLGYSQINIKHTGLEIGEKVENLYDNSTSPYETSRILKDFFQKKILNESHTNYLLNYMINDSTTHNRILGKLPPKTMVAHKTGTGYNSDTFIHACNDIGIIYLPNGKHIAVSIFAMNSKLGIKKTEELIADISKIIFQYYANSKKIITR